MLPNGTAKLGWRQEIKVFWFFLVTLSHVVLLKKPKELFLASTARTFLQGVYCCLMRTAGPKSMGRQGKTAETQVHELGLDWASVKKEEQTLHGFWRACACAVPASPLSRIQSKSGFCCHTAVLSCRASGHDSTLSLLVVQWQCRCWQSPGSVSRSQIKDQGGGSRMGADVTNTWWKSGMDLGWSAYLGYDMYVSEPERSDMRG